MHSSLLVREGKGSTVKMVSVIKIHGARIATVAVLLLCALLPSRAAMDEPDTYKHVAPSHSPAPATAPPPIQPVVIVQGVIYCKSCKLNGYNREMDASPLPNATAKLVCYGGKDSGYRLLNLTSTATDRNGYFLVMVYDVAMFSRRSCRVYLRSSPTALCDEPFVPRNASLGFTLAREEVKSPSTSPLPEGMRVYHPKSALMYGPRRGGKCPAPY